MRISSNSGLLFFALLSVFFILFSCERKEPLNNGAFNCAECYRDKPEWGPLNVILTINQENQYVPLTVYVGNIEDTIVDYVDTAYLKDYWVDVEPDRYYSVKAEYKHGLLLVSLGKAEKSKPRRIQIFTGE